MSRGHWNGVRAAFLFAFAPVFLFPGWNAWGEEPRPVSTVFRTRIDLPSAGSSMEAGVAGAADRLAVALTGASDAPRAWRELAGDKPGTILVQASPVQLNRPGETDLAEQVAARLVRHAPKNVRVLAWRGAKSKEAFEPKAAFDLPVSGKLIWGDLLFKGKDELSPRSHFAKEVMKATRIVNVAVMRGMEPCGVAGTLFNATIPNIDNSRRIIAAPSSGDPYLLEVYIRPELYPKIVAHFMDGTRIQFAGESAPEPNYQIDHHRCYASTDPVALDSLLLREIEPLRKAAKLPPIGPAAAYLQTAAAMGIGVFDSGRITVRDLPE
jgi:hypothetical protein